MDRDGVLVIRPASGDPVEVVLECLEILGRKFGYKLNSKEFKVLDPHVRLIKGDGIDHAMMRKILSAMMHNGWI